MLAQFYLPLSSLNFTYTRAQTKQKRKKRGVLFPEKRKCPSEKCYDRCSTLLELEDGHSKDLALAYLGFGELPVSQRQKTIRERERYVTGEEVFREDPPFSPPSV
ncbi:hypothetical protein MRX96_047877 [Rhipicephalus microplus]